MHGTWYILMSAWSAVLVFYLLLYVIAGKRLGGSAKKRSDITFCVIAVLAGLRILRRFVLGYGLFSRGAVLLSGVAAGFAALDLARMLAEQRQDNRNAGSRDERIESLKLS